MDPTQRTAPRYSHSGICVRDLDVSARFYRNVFGFELGKSIEICNAAHNLLGIVGDFRLQSRFLRRQGLVIELLQFSPTPAGSTESRSLNQIGLTHLSFNVDDLDQTLAQVLSHGGSALESTRSQFTTDGQTGEIIFVIDPDGTRIELMDFPQDICNA